MKNRRIVSLTVIIVAVVLIGMLGLSKFFETSWQQENTVDNSLSVEIVENDGSVFNYPYVNAELINNGKESIWENTYVMDDVVSVPENAITYQEAANIAGQAIRYSTGYMNHQKSDAFVDCHMWSRCISINSPLEFSVTKVKHEKLTVYKYVYFEDTDNDGIGVNIGARIDPFTKEIYTLDYNNAEYQSNNTGEWTAGVNDLIAVNEPLKSQLLSAAFEIKELCNNTSEITHYRVYERESNYGVVFIPSEINTKITILFDKGESPTFWAYSNTSVGGHYNHLIQEY